MAVTSAWSKGRVLEVPFLEENIQHLMTAERKRLMFFLWEVLPVGKIYSLSVEGPKPRNIWITVNGQCIISLYNNVLEPERETFGGVRERPGGRYWLWM